MAEPSNQPEGQQQANILSAAFPAPPPFYKSFIADNLARLKQLQHSGTQQQQQQQQRQGDGENDAGPSIEHKYDGVGDESSSEKSPATEDLPPELQYLIPPAPPTVGTYRSFGDSYSVSWISHCYLRIHHQVIRLDLDQLILEWRHARTGC